MVYKHGKVLAFLSSQKKVKISRNFFFFLNKKEFFRKI